MEEKELLLVCIDCDVNAKIKESLRCIKTIFAFWNVKEMMRKDMLVSVVLFVGKQKKVVLDENRDLENLNNLISNFLINSAESEKLNLPYFLGCAVSIQNKIKKRTNLKRSEILLLNSSIHDDDRHTDAIMSQAVYLKNQNIVVSGCSIIMQSQQMCELVGLTCGSYFYYINYDEMEKNFYSELLETFVFGSDRKKHLTGNKPCCVCHKKSVAIGYVCSGCLSIHCRQVKKCSHCGVEIFEN